MPGSTFLGPPNRGAFLPDAGRVGISMPGRGSETAASGRRCAYLGGVGWWWYSTWGSTHSISNIRFAAVIAVVPAVS